jgi:hypothetical protein
MGDFLHRHTGVDPPPLPPGSSLIDYDVQVSSGEWSAWQAKVPTIEIDSHSVTQADVVVPTMDTVPSFVNWTMHCLRKYIYVSSPLFVKLPLIFSLVGLFPIRHLSSSAFDCILETLDEHLDVSRCLILR